MSTPKQKISNSKNHSNQHTSKQKTSNLKNHSNQHKKVYLQTKSQPSSEVSKLKLEIKTLKDEIKLLNKNIINLEHQAIKLKLENQKNINDFQTKVKSFQTKAQEEVNKIRQELNHKFETDKQEIKAYSLQKFFESIIDPFMKLKQTIEYGNHSTDQNVKAYVVGFNMFIQQLLNEFKDFGLEEVVPKIGSQFNPDLHSVLSTVNNHPHQTIVEVKQNGFKLYERLIKPALVIVGK